MRMMTAEGAKDEASLAVAFAAPAVADPDPVVVPVVLAAVEAAVVVPAAVAVPAAVVVPEAVVVAAVVVAAVVVPDAVVVAVTAKHVCAPVPKAALP